MLGNTHLSEVQILDHQIKFKYFVFQIWATVSKHETKHSQIPDCSDWLVWVLCTILAVHFCGPVTVGRAALQHGTNAHAWAYTTQTRQYNWMPSSSLFPSQISITTLHNRYIRECFLVVSKTKESWIRMFENVWTSLSPANYFSSLYPFMYFLLK